MRERLKIDMNPRKLRIESDPYVLFVGRNYVPVIDVLDIKITREYYLIISSVSISARLREWSHENGGSITHIEFWINKQSNDKFAKYELELA